MFGQQVGAADLEVAWPLTVPLGRKGHAYASMVVLGLVLM